MYCDKDRNIVFVFECIICFKNEIRVLIILIYVLLNMDNEIEFEIGIYVFDIFMFWNKYFFCGSIFVLCICYILVICIELNLLDFDLFLWNWYLWVDIVSIL